MVCSKSKMIDDSTQLRKRTGRSTTRGEPGPSKRERSKEPPMLRRSDEDGRLSPVLESDAIWDHFKEIASVEYPDVTFPDEYIDDGIVTASINSPNHKHVSDIIELSKGAMKASVDAGRLLIEFDTGIYNNARRTKPSRSANGFFTYRLLTSLSFWVVVFWAMSFGLTVWFIDHNLENYMKLL